MLSPSISPRSSDYLRERAMIAAVSDNILEYCGGTREKDKLGGRLVSSQKSTPEWAAVARPAGMWIGRCFSILSLL